MSTATTQRAYGGPDRPTFPTVADDIGEDPARYLAADSGLDPWPRLSGIWDYPTARAFRAVARKLAAEGQLHEDGPRDVEGYLEELVATLDEDGCPWVGGSR